MNPAMTIVGAHVLEGLPRIGAIGSMGGAAIVAGATGQLMPGIMRGPSLIAGIGRDVGLRAPQGVFNQPAIAYGKRGLDGNRLSTDGLVQSLYRGRRSM